MVTEKPSGGFDIGKIPWSRKYGYGRDYLLLEGDSLEDFLYVMLHVELNFDAERKREEKEKEKKAKVPPLPPRTRKGR